MVNNEHHFRQGITNIPEICIRQGVRKVIIAPGSRNAPLIFAFTAHPQMECLSIIDERSAGFFALGMALQSGEPVALVCTSGTAVLNFAPAIAEAFYQHIPLLVFTADRPVEMIDQADGQTLHQPDIFGNYSKANFDLPVETVYDADLEYCNRQVSQAINTAIAYPPGPVQINVPLREPIYTALPVAHSNPKILDVMSTKALLTAETLSALQKTWLQSDRKMIVLGILPKSETFHDLVNLLSEMPDVVVIAENLSNVAGDKIITQPESLFSRLNGKTDNSMFAPDLLITIGSSIICKQLKIFLRKNKAVQHWQMDAAMPFVDTYTSLTTIIPVPARDVLGGMPFSEKTHSTKHYAAQFAAEMLAVKELHKAFVAKSEVSDMTVTKSLLALLPPYTILHLANSTAVRWTQLFPARTDLTYLCNRGTSGIDGCTSTAAGYAYCSGKLNVFLSGDLSFIYDSNALWNNYISKHFKIILLNNHGGNIFRFIGDKQLMEKSLDFFTTPQPVNIKALVEAFGLGYITCNKADSIAKSIQSLLCTEQATVLEIFTDSDLNTGNYTGYFKNIKK
ncbi:MAG: 2-succinyl-5-enolpyruvyl-6-hydroxy-3-cyclohexene-1-carboxylic-acid synthase [Porphyromonadaceae bacterium CG2_30_38_12]|nr:MAG: 2-succinyl-5-enolpyruvyl-6-hydroxy-3-cyclohexene-1-carboxylic-acid synthase [Porphyromonadaceae bacterium CG2_30_38_12]